MNDTTVQASPSWGAFRRWYFWVAALLALLLGLLWLLGYGPGGSACKAPMAVATAAAAPAVAAPVAEAAPAVAATAAPTPAPAALEATTPAAATPSPATPAAAMPAPEPAPTPAVQAPAVLPPAARVFFGLNRTTLPGDADTTLAEVVSFLKANPSAKAVLSGFHDPSGNKAYNEELALNRARAVKARLDQLGIADDRVVMQKPAETTGSGPAAEARRVEVAVQMP